MLRSSSVSWPLCLALPSPLGHHWASGDGSQQTSLGFLSLLSNLDLQMFFLNLIFVLLQMSAFFLLNGRTMFMIGTICFLNMIYRIFPLPNESKNSAPFLPKNIFALCLFLLPHNFSMLPEGIFGNHFGPVECGAKKD